MGHLSLHLHWGGLRTKYLNRQKNTMYDLGKMMARCVKLYSIIDQIMSIFKLIKKIEVSVLWDTYAYLLLFSK